MYFRFNEPALNTFDVDEAEYKNKAQYRLIDAVEVKVERLDELLARFLPPGQQIDFLSVDVEGLDEEVLRSNDWNRYRPRLILAETLRTSILNIANCPLFLYADHEPDMNFHCIN